MSIDVIYIIHANTALSIIDRPDHSPGSAVPRWFWRSNMACISAMPHYKHFG